MSTAELAGWEGTDVSVGEVERHLAALRTGEHGTFMRTSVLTHLAWVPPEWEHVALDTLEGLAERHPSRAILLLPERDASEDRIDAVIALRCFRVPGQERDICTEVVTLRLLGRRADAPASIAAPLLVADLPVFLRWRGRPPFGEQAFEQMVDLVDRLVVDSHEWPDVPAAYAELAAIFERVGASDIGWARTSRWRRQLASLWPGIGSVERIRVTGTRPQAHLLAGWLRSRLDRDVALEHEEADRLVGVEVDGTSAPFPPGDAPPASDLLSDELDRFGRDAVYEAAVRAAG